MQALIINDFLMKLIADTLISSLLFLMILPHHSMYTKQLQPMNDPVISKNLMLFTVIHTLPYATTIPQTDGLLRIERVHSIHIFVTCVCVYTSII